MQTSRSIALARSCEQTEQKIAYTGQQYVSDVMLFPTLRDVTNRHSWIYGLKQVHLCDTADLQMWGR